MSSYTCNIIHQLHLHVQERLYVKHQQILKVFLPVHQVSLGNNNIYNGCSNFRAKWAKYNGTTLKKDWIIITCIKDSEPQFGWINDVIISEEKKIILEILKCSIICYSNHYHSWLVEKTGQKCCLHHIHPRTGIE